MMTHFADGLS